MSIEVAYMHIAIAEKCCIVMINLNRSTPSHSIVLFIQSFKTQTTQLTMKFIHHLIVCCSDWFNQFGCIVQPNEKYVSEVHCVRLAVTQRSRDIAIRCVQPVDSTQSLLAESYPRLPTRRKIPRLFCGSFRICLE